jgi:hypothetical protein
MYGLGSSGRVIGAIGISSPRTKIGSAGRIYVDIKRRYGAFYALNYMKQNYSGLGPYSIVNNRLVWN